MAVRPGSGGLLGGGGLQCGRMDMCVTAHFVEDCGIDVGWVVGGEWRILVLDNMDRLVGIQGDHVLAVGVDPGFLREIS